MRSLDGDVEFEVSGGHSSRDAFRRQNVQSQKERSGLEVGMQDPWAVVRVHSVGQRQREWENTGDWEGTSDLTRMGTLLALT